MSSFIGSSAPSKPVYTLRLAQRDEIDRWHALMRCHHYLGFFERIVGQALYYIVTCTDQWVALLGWGSAALKCASRDQWIGWDQTKRLQRLHLIGDCQ